MTNLHRSVSAIRSRRLAFAAFGLLWLPCAAQCAEPAAFDALGGEYAREIRPLLKQFCLDCHATETKDGELDLERFATLEDVRLDPPVWQKVAEFLGNGEMPPEGNPQPTSEQRRQLRAWVDRYLDAEARANAGDPGPVVLRRLNNAEYTDTIRDLTGAPLDPAREFPVDGAAGEGFTNTGASLAMSPSLVEKYLAAGKDVAAHAVLLPDGIVFSPSTTRSDWTNERLNQIRAIYRHHTSGNRDVSRLNQWSVPNALSATGEDGRVDLAPYIAALIKHRDALRRSFNPQPQAKTNGDAPLASGDGLNETVLTTATNEQLNAKYLGLLAAALLANDQSSLLLQRIRDRLQTTTLDDVPSLVQEIAAWQAQLWQFNVVGHLGSIRPWQQAVAPVATSREFRLKLEPPSGGGDVSLFLVSGTAGDGHESDVVEWRNPRFERPGALPVRLRDLRGATAVLERNREQTLARTQNYLAAAFEAKSNPERIDVPALAAAHGVDGEMLQAWLAYLGIVAGKQAEFGELLHSPIRNGGGYEFVQGWGLPGVGDLSLVANSSDQKVNIPGDMNPHRVTVHPRPERWIAAGWKSPVHGAVRIVPAVTHAHRGCGNGVTFSVELRRGRQRRVLRAGNVGVGATAQIEPLESQHVRPGDIVALVIGPRDGNHACDLTEIDLRIEEIGGEQRVWSLAGDCADSVSAGNPHADRFGNAGIWHFTTGLLGDDASQPVIPDGSLAAKWLETTDPTAADALASQLGALLTLSAGTDIPASDAEVRSQLTALGGPLFGQVDFAHLAGQAAPEELASAAYGLDPQQFGRAPDGAAVDEADLVVRTPSVMELRLPASVLAGAEFVVSGDLHASAGEDAVIQLDVRAARPEVPDRLLPGIPIVTRAGSPAEARVRQAMDDFRRLFPIAMCYARVVPVDEAVTLVLFHREDEHLERLMLSDAERAQLDRLWDELHYVSQDALRSEVALEQILEFATQDADPKKFDPVLKPIADAAAAYRQRLVDTEPAHVTALVEFAGRAYRRPLRSDESERLRALYQTLRAENVPHDEAVRLLFARILTAPAFLYRLEEPGPGAKPSPVSGRELASRLSYFLWSSLPDEELNALADGGELTDADTLLAQTRRMLADDRVRRLAIEFGCQWLHVRDFDQFDEKSVEHFPEFRDLRDDMYEETVRFFTDLFQHDRSILSLLNADHTFLNATLAAHYGIPGVDGDEWRRVDNVRQNGRGGILTQATVLATQSGASRTSPILRGNWVSETLLNERLPRPPPNVPQLPEQAPANLSERQLIELHSSVPECAKCHARIDPYGFALEGFDTIGRFRKADANGHAIDVRTRLPDGTEIDGLDGLRDYLGTTRRHTFVRQFCRKLLGYALGRSVQLSDEPLLDEMLQRLEESDYRFSVAVETIVLSDQFRKIRGKEDPRADLSFNP